LVELISSSEYEENYVYLPEKEKWVEIGYKEETVFDLDNGLFYFGSNLDFDYFRELAKKNNKITIYHAHVDPWNVEEFNEKAKNLNDEDKKELKEIFSTIWVPSIPDIKAFKKMASIFYATNSNGILEDKYDISFYVFSKLGMCKISLKDLARKNNAYMFDILGGDIITQEEFYKYINSLKEKNELNIEEKICNHLSDQYFLFEYISP